MTSSDRYKTRYAGVQAAEFGLALAGPLASSSPNVKGHISRLAYTEYIDTAMPFEFANGAILRCETGSKFIPC